MEKNQFQDLLAQFQCQRCQECCKKPGYVYLQKGEDEKIAHYLKLDVFDFVNRYCELLDKQKLVLKKNTDESCIFLREYGCAVHAVKPVQCQDFPIKWRTESSFEYCAGLKKIFPKGEPLIP